MRSNEIVFFEKIPPICWITLNRPGQRNALSLDLIKDLKKNLQMISEDDDIRVVIIKGNGPSFCSGHDLNELVGEHDASYYQEIFTTCSELMGLLSLIPQPVIAMVHGAATAAGCQLVASCDLAIAETEAVFAAHGVKIGLFCSTPMVPLTRLIGRRRAFDMLFTGRFVSAMEAKDFGLVNKVVPKDLLESETRKMALEIAQYSKFTVESGKNVFYDTLDLEENDAYDAAIDSIVKNCLHEDAEEGIRAMLEKREPQWKK